MIGHLASPCRRHRSALLDFAAGGEIEPRTRAALAHLEICRMCEVEIERTALTVAAIRRAFREARRVEPRPDAWPRLRSRVARPSRSGRLTSPWGALAGAALAAALFAPHAFGPRLSPSLGGVGVDPNMIDLSELMERADQAAETRFLRGLPRAPSVTVTRFMAAPRRMYPDDWRPPARSQVPPPRIG